MTHVLVLGTGRFAAGLCRGLHRHAGQPLAVTVAGRSRAAAGRLVREVTADAGPGRVETRPCSVDFDDPADLVALLRATTPDLAVLCASGHSTAAMEVGSAWSELVRTFGLGITAPVQADVAVRVARACARTGIPFVNACFPDVVNPVVRAAGVPVLAGLGNGATLAAVGARQHGLREADVAMFGHHRQLHAPDDAADDARIRVHGRRVPDPAGWLAPVRALPRRELNARGAHHGAATVLDLACRSTRDTHLVAPGGLPGGYPVHLAAGEVSLRLPPGTDVDEVVRWQSGLNERDGAWVADGCLHVAAAAVAAVRAGGHAVADRLEAGRLGGGAPGWRRAQQELSRQPGPVAVTGVRRDQRD